jgi:hypothetical protein
MKYSVFVLSMALSTALFAQAPDTLWTKTFGGSYNETCNSVQQTSDGGYIIAGSTRSFGAGLYDFWLIKTDSEGDTVWTRTFGGSLHDWGRSAQQTSDGGYIITGISDVLLIKTDTNGDTLWTKTYSGSGNFVQQTSDNGYILCGDISDDLLLVRTDVNGDTLWTKTYGGNLIDCGNSVQQTTDGGFIVTGVKDETTVGQDRSYVWLIKTDTNGDTLWTRTFIGNQIAQGYSVQQTSDGGYIIAGVTNAIWSHPFSFGNAWLIKTDANGDTLWTNTFGDSLGGQRGYSVQQTSDGGYIFTGFTNSTDIDLWLIKTDANGDTLWTKTFGDSLSDFGYSVQQTSDGGYIIAGETSSIGAGGSDVWLIKFAPDITSINQNPHTSITGYQLKQNYPNPFNPSTTIEFAIPKAGFVTLTIYDVLGEKVSTLVSENLTAGSYQYQWNAGDLASGVYFYSIEASGFTKSRKMLLIR